MLEPLFSVLDKKRIVLASASPRRREILRVLGLRCQIVASSFKENLDKSRFAQPVDYALATAIGKAQSVAKALREEPTPVDLVIGADTIVVQDGQILEKPKDASDAVRMLTQLSGKTHLVQTGVALVHWCGSELKTRTLQETTEVSVALLSPAVIEAYVATGEPFDKAGAYGIQGKGGSLVERINGDYFNVVGFPMHRFCRELTKWCAESCQ
ncbi:probable bifunctional dTTP/UTP pyrophosphatase/methyltransferase protein [Ixodes scapularis]|uniref:probable bifunctional dTTP/UTP pyrophosphatase/methyltransferase protein n=1 Tax=Ixodes scapularis TaxID=6945 RepID=UPI001A9E92FD|nr:probable bifunctional dTTP/UTP pyrophosphatase/methyltransferase protein [Ixodes scapularis]